MKTREKPGPYPLIHSKRTIRWVAAILIPILLGIGVLSLYWIVEGLLPIYLNLYSNSEIIETPYLMFGLLMAPPSLLLAVIGLTVALWTGKRFDPVPSTRIFKFQCLMANASLKTLTYIVPGAAIVTTGILIIKDYRPCPGFLISGSAWQVFWVNEEHACLRQGQPINDNRHSKTQK